MTSTSEEERLKAEIAKLSGAIQTHKQQHHTNQPAYQSYGGAYASRGRGYYPAAGSSSYRGAYTNHRGGYHAAPAAGRGRGRGAASIPPRNRTLILNDSSAKTTPQSATNAASSSNATDKPDTSETAAPGTPSTSNASTTTSSTPAPKDGWIKRKSTHNMSLVSTSTFQRTEPARLAAMEATRKAKAEAKAAASSSGKKAARGKPVKPSSSVRRGDNMGEVVIDGVVFEFDPSGTKLVKKAVQPSTSDSAHDNTSAAATSSAAASSSSTSAVPLKTSINGQDYIRTKRGNLISAELLAKRKAQREAAAKMGRLDKMVGQISAIQATRNSRSKPGARTLDVKKARTLCTFFNKTGQCKRGLSCPYLHDSSKIALCPKVLRTSGCTLPKGTCPLSHTPRAERVPHCVHYLRTGRCRNGDACLYTHSDKLADGVSTKICRDFSDYGWCDRGAECTERHTYECPDFVEKGKCDRKGCKLVHVIRARAADGNDTKHDVADPEDAGGEGLQDDMLFMRDDAAAAADEASEPGSEDEARSRNGKRKRPLMQTELDDDQQMLPSDNDDVDNDDDADDRVDFANTYETRTAKRRKAKAFTQQKDFISFDDEEDDEEDADEEGEDEEAVDSEAEDDEQMEAGSVHSEDFELSEGEDDEAGGEDDAEDSEDVDENEEEEDEEEDAESSYSQAGAASVGYSKTEHDDEDDDDDLVDRDL